MTIVLCTQKFIYSTGATEKHKGDEESSRPQIDPEGTYVAMFLAVMCVWHAAAYVVYTYVIT